MRPLTATRRSTRLAIRGALGALVLVAGPASMAGQADATLGSVYGRVLSAETGEPIAGAAIEVRHRGVFRFLVSDSNGAYLARGLTPGPVVVIARALDRAPLETALHLPRGGEVPLDMGLALRPMIVPSLFAAIESRRLSPPGLTRDGFRREGETELRALEGTPGLAELGLAGNAGPDPQDPSSVLYVRGAAADLKLVLLDGAPVFAPFHLSGLLDAFPDGILDSASLYIGGTPARYDGGLSYVLTLDLREGTERGLRTAGAVDVLGATARVEGPIGSVGRALVSGRALHGAGYPMIAGGGDLPYGYGDALARVDFDLGASRLSATGFLNRESVLLNVGKLEDAGAAESAYWGNQAASARYRLPLGSGTLHVTGAYGRFRTRLPVPRETDGPIDFANAEGRTSRSRTEAFYESAAGRARWAVGAGLDTHETLLDQRTVLGDTTARAIGRANVGGVWGEAIWDVSSEVELRAGVRASYFTPENTARFSPRATATWHVSESSDLRISAGRFAQIVRGPESILSSDLTGPTVGGRGRPILDSDLTSDELPLLGIANSTHVVVGLENRLRNGIELGLEGYFKSFDDLPGAEQLLSSGADIWVQAKEGPVRGWLGYSLAWVWDNEPAEDNSFVGRQLLSGGLSSELRGFDLGFRLSYGAGLPFSSVSKANQADSGLGDVNDPNPVDVISGAPDDSYLRIDAEISRRWVTGVGDARMEIAPYVRLLNALDRRDALFYQTGGGDATRPAPLSSVPLLAVFGVAWAF
ncbi:MAG: TonB-dependent receptor [Gemmatimonadetes bacterium]|nr:TonB-dependent receptor [Gemmatimonadota bacterium]